MSRKLIDYWPGFIQALGYPVTSVNVKYPFSALGESPVVSETPDFYNDPQGRTQFYKFVVSGFEFGFRAEVLNHIHVFVQGNEGYSAYKADMLDRSAQAWKRDEIIRHHGPAQNEAASNSDSLIGHTQAWVRYEFDKYDLRMEFSDDGHLWKATLMGK